MRVRNKVLVISGAGSGIGREIALNVISKGARVAGIDLAPQSLEETGTLAGGNAQRFAGFVADITQRDAVEALPEQVIEQFGAVDGVINNAGVIQPFRRLADLAYPDIERVLNVNLYGTLFATKAFLPHLLKRPEAHIVNVSSMGGFLPVPGQTMYCAAKAAVKLMTEGLAAELLATKIRVSVVSPGAVATNIRTNSGVGGLHAGQRNKSSKALPAADAAEIIVRGIERNAPRIFVGPDAVFMDKLVRLNPGFAARAIGRRMAAMLPV
jgi:NADP-dependent 3-hydroxy acid dehydrogenase YdfG